MTLHTFQSFGSLKELVGNKREVYISENISHIRLQFSIELYCTFTSEHDYFKSVSQILRHTENTTLCKHPQNWNVSTFLIWLNVIAWNIMPFHMCLLNCTRIHRWLKELANNICDGLTDDAVSPATVWSTSEPCITLFIIFFEVSARLTWLAWMLCHWWDITNFHTDTII